MPASQLAAALHALVILAGVIAATVLTATGHDGNPVLVGALSWGGAAVTDRTIDAASSGPKS